MQPAEERKKKDQGIKKQESDYRTTRRRKTGPGKEKARVRLQNNPQKKDRTREGKSKDRKRKKKYHRTKKKDYGINDPAEHGKTKHTDPQRKNGDF